MASSSSTTMPMAKLATPIDNKPRSSSNASSNSMGSETGRLLKSLGSVEGFADIGSGLEPCGTPVAASRPKESVAAATAVATGAATHETNVVTAQHDTTAAPAPAPAPLPPEVEENDGDKKPKAAEKNQSLPPQPRVHVHFPKHLQPSSREGGGQTTSSSKGSRHHHVPERRLPTKKRKLSHETYESRLQLSDSGADPPSAGTSSFSISKRKMSVESHGKMSLESQGSHSALERSESNYLIARHRKMSTESYGSAMGDISLGLESLDSDIIQKQAPGDMHGSLELKGSGDDLPPPAHVTLPELGNSAMDHLDALGEEAATAAAANMPHPAPIAALQKSGNNNATRHPGAPKRARKGSSEAATSTEPNDNHSKESDDTFSTNGHRILMEAIEATSGGGGRKRLESWGGMSDLSVTGGGRSRSNSVDAAAAAMATALQQTGILDDVMAAANMDVGSDASSFGDLGFFSTKPRSSSIEAFVRDRTGSIEAFFRDRKESLASFSDHTPLTGNSDGLEISSELQKFVTQAVASVGDQLAELAGNIETVVEIPEKSDKHDDAASLGSKSNSTATPVKTLIGAALDDPSRATISGHMITHQTDVTGASSGAIMVDYDAVAAAVDAANAAVGGIDLETIGVPSKGTHKLPSNSGRKRPHDVSFHLSNVPHSSLSEQEQAEIRQRARRAAGYTPPSDFVDNLKTPARHIPLKKRLTQDTPDVPGSAKSMNDTPRVSNTSGRGVVPSVVFSAPSASSSKLGCKEKSTQKWDSMYECLLQFVQDRKHEETAGLSPEDVADWVWDGNVPTTYKNRDGKALGRWINNQRSAKSKGNLKDEREQRLVNAGLKWSVLASNSWNEMLDELRIYIKEYTMDGKKWDGNVPTNYRIKARANGKKLTEEDKNLGRWVNRQRSLYQAGKLRKDRQLALESVGLKWSMLATTSWESMYETLVEYVNEKKKKGIKWDGNVPANYKTDDNPPRALGRWINRQRSAYVKKKLKKECVEKLTTLGLKWSVHERKFPEHDGYIHLHPQHATSTQGYASSAESLLQSNNAATPGQVVSASGVAVSTSQQNPIPASIGVPAVKVQLNSPPLQPVQGAGAGSSDIHPDHVASAHANDSDQNSPASQDTVKGGNKNKSFFNPIPKLVELAKPPVPSLISSAAPAPKPIGTVAAKQPGLKPEISMPIPAKAQALPVEGKKDGHTTENPNLNGGAATPDACSADAAEPRESVTDTVDREGTVIVPAEASVAPSFENMDGSGLAKETLGTVPSSRDTTEQSQAAAMAMEKVEGPHVQAVAKSTHEAESAGESKSALTLPSATITDVQKAVDQTPVHATKQPELAAESVCKNGKPVEAMVTEGFSSAKAAVSSASDKKSVAKTSEELENNTPDVAHGEGALQPDAPPSDDAVVPEDFDDTESDGGKASTASSQSSTSVVVLEAKTKTVERDSCKTTPDNEEESVPCEPTLRPDDEAEEPPAKRTRELRPDRKIATPVKKTDAKVKADESSSPPRRAKRNSDDKAHAEEKATPKRSTRRGTRVR